MTPSQYLIRGADYLATQPNFKLIGRDEDLSKLSSILMRKKSNSVLLVGPSGVGCTALLLGLQESKLDDDAPFDIVNKRLFWLDTDCLFSSGDCQQINTAFQRVIDHLSRTPETVLIIEDTRDFIEASRTSGNTHFINAITMAVKSDKTQVILECRDSDLEFVLKWHSDIRESYTMIDLQEPKGEFLTEIVTAISKNLSAHHDIPISEDALASAIELTTKYRMDAGLSEAQPVRTISLLDRALSSYRLVAHKRHPALVSLEQQIAKSDGDAKTVLQARHVELEADWAEKQVRVKRLYRLQRDGEIAVTELQEEIETIEAAKKKKAEERARSGEEQADPDTPVRASIGRFAALSGQAGFESDEVSILRQKIDNFETEIGKNKGLFKALTTEINKDLVLTRACVMQEFSRISGIAVNKLNENELEILRSLDNTLKRRIFGQNEVLDRVSNAIKIARIGRRNRDKPQAAFMFMGPSGVGKTEVAKAIAQSLLGDEKALTRFDMSEYMEKHAVAKLIGAPPGYEGFEAGGILTNAMRKNRNRVLLFDEIEKANPDVFNIFLQILSDGRLTDNVGRVVDFSESIIVMTTNVGQPYFLDEKLSFEEAVAHANADLDSEYRAEFLNRFAGRQNIIPFKRLALDSIEKIVRRELVDLDQSYAGNGVHSIVEDDALKAFCEQHYDMRVGARGLPGYIQANLEPIIVNRILEVPGTRGTFKIGYDRSTRSFDVGFDQEKEAA